MSSQRFSPDYVPPIVAEWDHSNAARNGAPRAQTFLRNRAADLARIVDELLELGIPYVETQHIREEQAETELTLMALVGHITTPRAPSAKKPAQKPSKKTAPLVKTHAGGKPNAVLPEPKPKSKRGGARPGAGRKPKATAERRTLPLPIEPAAPSFGQHPPKFTPPPPLSDFISEEEQARIHADAEAVRRERVTTHEPAKNGGVPLSNAPDEPDLEHAAAVFGVQS